MNQRSQQFWGKIGASRTLVNILVLTRFERIEGDLSNRDFFSEWSYLERGKGMYVQWVSHDTHTHTHRHTDTHRYTHTPPTWTTSIYIWSHTLSTHYYFDFTSYIVLIECCWIPEPLFFSTIYWCSGNQSTENFKKSYCVNSSNFFKVSGLHLTISKSGILAISLPVFRGCWKIQWSNRVKMLHKLYIEIYNNGIVNVLYKHKNPMS